MPTKTENYKGKKGFNVLNTEHFGIQRKIVANMTTQSWNEAPHCSYVYEPDITDFMKEYEKLRNSSDHPLKISINTLMLRIVVEGIKKAPQINGHLKYQKRLVRGKFKTFSDINISMPMILPGGEMMTINLHNFEDKSLNEMAEYIENVREKIKNTNLTQAMFDVSLDNTMQALKHFKIMTTVCRLVGAKLGKHRVVTLKGKAKKEYKKIPNDIKLTKSDIEQGTITVSNLGPLYRGSSIGKPVLLNIIPPQVFAIAIGSIIEKPGVYTDEKGEKQIGIRKYMPLCLSFDHRALDFGDVVPFLTRLDGIFEKPEQINNW
ncbi:MAG TPA: 2-oxo acid dehydrogenase subunit E2 [Clostridia bacterium]|nr:2-oxo acid dehydrogenase subunit E2 [Clostridia bacterium]